jgi:hypothetical protein
LEISKTGFDQNKAMAGDGGNGGVADLDFFFSTEGFGANGGDSAGGALSIRNSATLTNLTIAECLAIGGTGGSLGLNESCSGPEHYGTGSGGNATGGAIDVSGSAATIVNCTFVQNKTAPGAGGPTNGYCTFVGLPGAANGSTIFQSGAARLEFSNSIFVSSNGADIFSGAFVDDGHNIVSGPAPGFTSGTSLTNTDARLVEVNAVGSLPFYRPALDSPARDAVPPQDAPQTDQRGVLRPVGAMSDIGAIELDASEIPPAFTLDPGPTMTLNYIGRPGSDYALFTTTDFQTWTGVRTNRADEAGRILFDSLDRVLSPRRFFYSREIGH